jgi:hypothetical protein
LFLNYSRDPFVFEGVTYPVVGKTRLASRENPGILSQTAVTSLSDLILTFEPRPIQAESELLVLPLTGFMLLLSELRFLLERMNAIAANEVLLTSEALRSRQIDSEMQAIGPGGIAVLQALAESHRLRAELWDWLRCTAGAVALEDGKLLRLPTLEELGCEAPEPMSWHRFVEKNPQYQALFSLNP